LKHSKNVNSQMVDSVGEEEIRQKITRIAELFEKKEIKQKYSVEVLFDFCFDKTKKLFGKYHDL